MKRTNSHSSLIYSLLPLVIYEVIFVLFVIYYSRQDILWFRTAYLATCLALVVSLVKTLTCYRSWQQTFPAKRTETTCLVFYFASLIVYIFCLFILAEGWYNPLSPPLVIFILLSIPPVTEFIIFLSSDREQIGR